MLKYKYFEKNNIGKVVPNMTEFIYIYIYIFWLNEVKMILYESLYYL